MKILQYLLSSLLLAVACNCSEAAPTVQQADGAHDVRWRLVSGLETVYKYSNQMVCDIELLLNITGDLKLILDGLCELVEIQSLVSKLHNRSDLNAILEQNVLDSCQWLNFLVELNSTEVIASERFLELNDTCEMGDMQRLNQYCIEARLDSIYSNVYLPASDYYAQAGTVVDQDVPIWLENSPIPVEDAANIEEKLKHFSSCNS